MKKMRICATCEYNQSIVNNGMPGCQSCCTKRKNRKYTIYMKKQNEINPVTGKPNSECPVVDPNDLQKILDIDWDSYYEDDYDWDRRSERRKELKQKYGLIPKDAPTKPLKKKKHWWNS